MSRFSAAAAVALLLDAAPAFAVGPLPAGLKAAATAKLVTDFLAK